MIKLFYIYCVINVNLWPVKLILLKVDDMKQTLSTYNWVINCQLKYIENLQVIVRKQPFHFYIGGGGCIFFYFLLPDIM